ERFCPPYSSSFGTRNAMSTRACCRNCWKVQVALAHEFGLAAILPRSISWAPEPARYHACVDALDRGGFPVVDHCRSPLTLIAGRARPRLAQGGVELPPGLTRLALHCTGPATSRWPRITKREVTRVPYRDLVSGWFWREGKVPIDELQTDLDTWIKEYNE